MQIVEKCAIVFVNVIKKLNFDEVKMFPNSGYRLHLKLYRSMLALRQEVGTLMIHFAGPFLKKSSCKVLKPFRSVYVLMDMSMLWWITSGIGEK